jgi:WD40 repeat protein
VRQLTAEGRQLSTVAFSPDGKTVAAGGGSWARTTLWDVTTGADLQTFGGPHPPRAGRLAFSADGMLLAMADGSIRVCDVATGAQCRAAERLNRSTESVGAVAFSPVGTILVLAGRDSLRLWDVQAGREVRRIDVAGADSCGVAFAPDGKHLAWGGPGNVVRLWETTTGKELHADAGPQGQVFFVGFGRGGRMALTGDTSAVRAWDLGAGKEPFASHGRRGELLPGVSGIPLALSPEGKTLVTGGWSGKFRLFNVATGAEVNPFPVPPDGGAIKAAFTPDGKRLLVVTADWRTMVLWDLTAGTEVRRFVGHNSPVDAIAFSPDGKLLVSSGTPRAMIRQPPPGFQEDTGTRVWDVATGKELRQFSGREGALAFSPDGALLAAGSDGWGAGVRLLDPDTGVEVRRLGANGYGPYRLAFSPDGKTLATVGRDKTVRLWEAATGGERRQFAGHGGDVFSVAFSPDGRRLLSGGADTTAFLWDAYAPDRPTPADLAPAVQALDSSDAATAYHVVCALIAEPERAVPLLAAAVRPAEPPEPQRLARLIADLDGERFAARERATAELAKLGDAAGPALQQLLDGKPTPEARRRAEQLLTDLKTNTAPARLRGLRAVEVLEAVGTPEARRELGRLAGGAPGARLTREARAALDRLERRSAKRWSPPAAEPPADLEALLGGPVKGGTAADGAPLPPWAVVRIGRPSQPGKAAPRMIPAADARSAVVHGDELPKIGLLDLPSGRERQSIASPNRFQYVGCVAQSPDGLRLAVDDSNGPMRPTHLYLWEWASGRELWRVETTEQRTTGLAFSPAGDLLATVGMDHFVRLRDAATGKELRNWSFPGEYNMPLAFTPDGKRLAVGGPKIRLWDVATGQAVAALDGGAGSFAFSPDGGLLIAGQNGLVSVWELAPGRRRLVIDHHLRGAVFSLAVSPDGRSLLTGCRDGQVRLWELATGKERAHFAGHKDDLWVSPVAITPDGRTAASSGGDGFLFVWDLTGLAPDGRLAQVELSDAQRAGLWRLLAGDDAAVAYRAGWRLTAGGDGSAAFLKRRLAPVPWDIGPHVEQLLAELGSPSESVRQAATERLEYFGPLATAALRKSLADRPTGEARDRIEYLLGRAERATPCGEHLRALRAIEVLERIGTPAARAVLGELTAGLPEAAITREAGQSCRRLEQRVTDKP